MTSQNVRFFLMAVLGVVGMMLYQAWQHEHGVSLTEKKPNAVTLAKASEDREIPDTHPALSSSPETPAVPLPPVSRQVRVKTDVLELTIDTAGGDIVRLTLPNYVDEREGHNIEHVLFDQSEKRYYIAQSGMSSQQGPDVPLKGRAVFTTQETTYELPNGENELVVDLKTETKQGVFITKRFKFRRGDYLIGVEYLIKNQSTENYRASPYARLKRKGSAETTGAFMGVQTFTGAAISTPETPYKKFTFKDIQEKPFEKSLQGGFAAMDEHYFVSAWVPSKDSTNLYQTLKLGSDIFGVGFVSSPIEVAPTQTKSIALQLYAGPEVAETLEKIAPGLQYAVDYGILWPICQPIFWLLKKLYQLTGNWGVAIILITVLIKGIFYKLSASSYRSMANMRRLQPKIEALKQRYADDKAKFSQAVMELYKKEKVNPVGGCLPILVQIPVFISLYYTLLGSVELRLAPFMLWLTDLSDKDPYYVLPLLMGASMFLQQKMSPPPADPVQAKVMLLMPIIFTALFLNFPSGLVLYWLVNNLLSISQQWFISKQFEKTVAHHGAK
jgi:YidC/Oxa1 family membrane protein insertase